MNFSTYANKNYLVILKLFEVLITPYEHQHFTLISNTNTMTRNIYKLENISIIYR